MAIVLEAHVTTILIHLLQTVRVPDSHTSVAQAQEAQEAILILEVQAEKAIQDQATIETMVVDTSAVADTNKNHELL